MNETNREEDAAISPAQAQKLEALGRLAGGIAHDFNNILSIIEGHASLAVRHLQDGKLTPHQLHRIMAATQRGAELTRQLLAFSRQKVSVDEKINLSETLKQQNVLIAAALGEKIRLHMQMPADDIWIMGSHDSIAQILLNIAVNARDTLQQGGEMTIACRRALKGDRSYARVTVTDTGPGMARDALQRIFDPFFASSLARGGGLGLSVVYGLAEQMGGSVEARSEPGKGMTFEIDFPIVEYDAHIAFEDRAPEIPLGLYGKTLLLAEDEEELRDVLAVILGGMGLKVLTAGNGNQAMFLQQEYDGPIDFLLTDVVMPEMDGLSLGERFRAERPESNVIYMSGYPFLDGGCKLGLPPGADFISKPLQEDKIRKILERALQRRDEREKEEE